MTIQAGFESSSRDLVRILRVHALGPVAGTMPEADVWRIYCELRRRRSEKAGASLVEALHQLHDRRLTGPPSTLPDDPAPQDHRWVDDAFLGELWRAYKRCIRQGRLGPARQILRDLEAHLTACGGSVAPDQAPSSRPPITSVQASTSP
ncbi:MAG: hypothetical protein JXB39_09020 [Deltaproteobacteria bacterium]|nr:hypothetical protein [Deltaproteobacteria bacterium]